MVAGDEWVTTCPGLPAVEPPPALLGTRTGHSDSPASSCRWCDNATLDNSCRDSCRDTEKGCLVLRLTVGSPAQRRPGE